MERVTKADVDSALLAWQQAAERAQQELLGWGRLLKSQQVLIQSMIDNGWTYGRARRDVDMASNVHSADLQAAVQEMDERCSAYKEIEARYAAQQA